MPVAVGVMADSYNKPAAVGPVTGMFAWWDAADTATITHSGGAVSQWNDKSGSNRHLLQGTAAAKPTTGSRTINGNNALAFGTPDMDTLTTPTPITLPVPITVFAVTLNDSSSTAIQNWVMAGPSFTFTIYRGGGAGSYWQLYNGATLSTTMSPGVNAPHVTSSLFNSSSSQFWQDGVGSAVANTGTQGMSSQQLTVGGGGGTPWIGLIAELLIYNRAVTTTERQQVESYLKSKWGTP